MKTPDPVDGWGIMWANPRRVATHGHPFLWWDFFYSRREAHRHVEERLGQPWKKLYRQGLRAVRVRLETTR